MDVYVLQCDVQRPGGAWKREKRRVTADDISRLNSAPVGSDAYLLEVRRLIGDMPDGTLVVGLSAVRTADDIANSQEQSPQ